MDLSMSSTVGCYQRIVNEFRAVLPTKFVNSGTCRHMVVSSSGLIIDLNNVESSFSVTSSYAARANLHIPASCPVFYFEIAVQCKDKNGYFGIGLSTRNTPLLKFPGQDGTSYGYHSDDGFIFSSSPAGPAFTGKPYGPVFRDGDIIGCGLNNFTSTLFFTKNGSDLGIAFSNIPRSSELIPTVGMRHPAVHLSANFGKSKFKFNIDGLLESKLLNTRAAIKVGPWPSMKEVPGLGGVIPSDFKPSIQLDKLNERRKRYISNFKAMEAIREIIMGYLMHYGYCESAQMFAKEAGFNNIAEYASDTKNNCKMFLRNEIKRLLGIGKVSDACVLVDECFPQLWDKNPTLLYKISVSAFLESVIGNDDAYGNKKICDILDRVGEKLQLENSEEAAADTAADPTGKAVFDLVSAEETQHQQRELREKQDEIDVYDSSSSSSDDDDQDKEEEEEEDDDDDDDDDDKNDDDEAMDGSNIEQAGATNGWTALYNQQVELYKPDLEDRSFVTDKKVRNFLYAKKIMKFVTEQMGSKLFKTDQSILERIFSTMAYSDLNDCPDKHLLPADAQRQQLVAAVNNTILDISGNFTLPTLETILSHCTRLSEMLQEKGDKLISVVDIDSWL